MGMSSGSYAQAAAYGSSNSQQWNDLNFYSPPKPAAGQLANPAAATPSQYPTHPHQHASPPINNDWGTDSSMGGIGMSTSMGDTTASMRARPIHSPSTSGLPQPAFPNQPSAAATSAAAPHHAVTGSMAGGNVPFMPQQIMANPMAGMAFDYGKAHLAKNLSWVMSFLSALKVYFHVNNRYVLSKLKILLLPFAHKNWRRERSGEAGTPLTVGGKGNGPVAGAGPGMDDGLPPYLPPSSDVNAPDLYIPTMSFLTFVLAMAYALGTANQFHPEVIGLTASRTLIMLFFEVLGMKAGLYLIAVGPGAAAISGISMLDLAAYAAYKYVHCILMIICGLTLGSFAFYLSILIIGSIAALFMMRTMKSVVSPTILAAPLGNEGGASIYGSHIDAHPNYGAGKHRRNYFLIIIGCIQIFIAWFLVRTANAGF